MGRFRAKAHCRHARGAGSLNSLLSDRVERLMTIPAVGPITALTSLTTPAVSRDFILIFSVHAQTFPVERESRLCGRFFHL